MGSPLRTLVQVIVGTSLALGCTYKPQVHAPLASEQYAPVDAATLTKLENGFARLSQGMANDEDVALLRSMTGKHLKIEGRLHYADVSDPDAWTLGLLISPADAPDRKVVIHERRFSTRKIRDQMSQHLAGKAGEATAYVLVRDDTREPDPFELHAIGLPDDTYLQY